MVSFFFNCLKGTKIDVSSVKAISWAWKVRAALSVLLIHVILILLRLLYEGMIIFEHKLTAASSLRRLTSWICWYTEKRKEAVAKPKVSVICFSVVCRMNPIFEWPHIGQSSRIWKEAINDKRSSLNQVGSASGLDKPFLSHHTWPTGCNIIPLLRDSVSVLVSWGYSKGHSAVKVPYPMHAWTFESS